MDLNEPMILTQANNSIVLPTVNIIRLGLIKMSPLIEEYKQSHPKHDELNEFFEWAKERIGISKGKVLL